MHGQIGLFYHAYLQDWHNRLSFWIFAEEHGNNRLGMVVSLDILVVSVVQIKRTKPLRSV